MKPIFIFISLFISAGLAPLAARPQFEVVSSQDRQTSATEHLTGKTDQIAVYTKGLVCSSCGIGLRVHLKKLKGIDKTQFNKGIQIDAAKQLIIIAYQQGVEPDTAAVYEAIDNAGYEAAHYYRWDGQSVTVHSFEKAQ